MYAATASAPLVNSGRRTGVVAGRITTSLAAVFLIFDGGAKVLKAKQVIDATAQLGFPVQTIPLIGALLLLSTLVYVIPQTALLGAVLLTGYLGGAIAVQLRVGNPLFEMIFPVFVAMAIWGGLLLRDPGLRALVRPRRRDETV